MKQKQTTHHNLSHHHLRVFGVARKLNRLVFGRPIGHAELRRQAQNASLSVGLNIAEGAGQFGGARKRHYKIAKGSVIEVVAAYELAEDIGESVPVREVQDLGDAIAAMLAGLIR
jgi:four helix bundle protein